MFAFSHVFSDVLRVFDADLASSVGYSIDAGVTESFLECFCWEKVIRLYLNTLIV